MVTAGFEAEMNKKVSFMLITIVSNGGPMRSVTAIESDGLMAKDRVATYKMGLQRIGCSNIIILNVMMLMVYRRQKREISHLYANPATGSNLALARSVVISVANAAFNI